MASVAIGITDRRIRSPSSRSLSISIQTPSPQTAASVVGFVTRANVQAADNAMADPIVVPLRKASHAQTATIAAAGTSVSPATASAAKFGIEMIARAAMAAHNPGAPT